MKRPEVNPNVFVRFICLTLVFSVSLYAETLVWSDEFNGPGIDKNVWSYETGGSGFGNGELEYYTALPSNAYTEDGKLVIQAKRENYSDKSFTSARLHTSGRLFFKYGRVEARVKVPDLREGLWSAFWMMGNNFNQVGWPASGELDILEMGTEGARLAGVTNRRVGATAHWEYGGAYAGYGLTTDAASDLNNAYHTYSLTWTPTTLKASLDGVQFWVMGISGGAESDMEEFHAPFFLIVNLAVGGSNFVNISDPALITASFPAKMYVDWIRLYDEVIQNLPKRRILPRQETLVFLPKPHRLMIRLPLALGKTSFYGMA
jgi:beta-glucanase (GH16 family)